MEVGNSGALNQAHQKRLYDRNFAQVRVKGGLIDAPETAKGVRQGCILSPAQQQMAGQEESLLEGKNYPT